MVRSFPSTLPVSLLVSARYSHHHILLTLFPLSHSPACPSFSSLAFPLLPLFYCAAGHTIYHSPTLLSSPLLSSPLLSTVAFLLPDCQQTLRCRPPSLSHSLRPSSCPSLAPSSPPFCCAARHLIHHSPPLSSSLFLSPLAFLLPDCQVPSTRGGHRTQGSRCLLLAFVDYAIDPLDPANTFNLKGSCGHVARADRDARDP